MATSERETGDRQRFLASIRARQRPHGPAAEAIASPHPPPGPPPSVPRVGYRVLDGRDPTPGSADLVEVFVDRACAAEATVWRGGPRGDGGLPDLVARHGIVHAVRSRDHGLDHWADILAGLGVRVVEFDPRDFAAGAALETADRADVVSLSVASHAMASTGSVVVDAATAGSRSASLLAPVQVCIVPVDRLVATHAEVLRDQRPPMPSCRVVITGPSRTGDIEQRLTLGAHGPVALHLVVVDGSPADGPQSAP